MTTAVTDRPGTETPAPVHTGGMIAMVPADPGMLAVEGGAPLEQLHLTLAYLGDDVTDWDPEAVAAVHRVARELTDPAAVTDDTQPVPADGEDYRGPGQRGPLTLTVFSWSQFNPNGGPDGQEPCLVYQFSGDGDLGTVESLASEVQIQVRSAIGGVLFPERHARFAAHVTAGYNLPADALSHTGPVVFDRLRVALADEVTDYPMGGTALDRFGTTNEVLTADSARSSTIIASGIPGAPPIDWFQDPGLTELTPLTVTDEGRVFGHLAGWGVRHRGLNGHITPPRSHSGYADFLLHSARAADGDEVRTVAVGNLTMGTNHADLSLNSSGAKEHYDSTGSVVAQTAMGEDALGVWYAGAILPDVDDLRLRRFMSCGLSGDWRQSDQGSLELCAALSVPVPGFPIPRARVASGVPLALVAAGALVPRADAVASVDYDILADAIADRLDARRAVTAALTTQRNDLLADLDDRGDRMLELLVELYDGDEEALTAAVSTMPPQLQKSYLSGKVAARIRWKTPGDWGRCRIQALKHGMTPHQAAGACNRLHKLATGVYPGDRRNTG